MPPEFPPACRQVAGARMIDLEQLGAECLGPQREDSMNAIAGEAGAQKTRRRQAAPGRLTRARITRRGVAKTAVAAEIAVKAVGIHRVQKRWGLAFGSDHRRPPLVADGWNLGEVE